MRCRTCDYPLWNLKTRQCPECGSPFSPDEYQFVASSVRFCCPHCDQAYYGTDDRGHLDPVSFTCIGCGRPVHMNDTVLLPAEGVTEQATRVGVNPWLERHRMGRIRAWFSTVGGALVGPLRLMRGTDVDSSLGQAWWFLLVTMAVTFAVALVPATCMVIAMPFMMGGLGAPAGQGLPGPGWMSLIMAGSMLVGFIIAFIFVSLFALVWGLVAHALLRITGPAPGPLRRTFQAICYSGGTLALSAIPCISNAATPWWVVSAVLMVKQGHQVHGGRAAFAVITFPVLLLGLGIAAYIGLIALAISAGTAAPSAAAVATQDLQTVLDSITDYAADHQGRGPKHAIELVTDGTLAEWDLVAWGTDTVIDDVPLADVNLLDFEMMTDDQRRQVVQGAAAGQPPGILAHRVGDFVFTYHGIDVSTAEPNLWLVVMSPDPDAGGQLSANLVVGRADGTVLPIPPTSFALLLTRQNELRAAAGLAPLPHPSTITHDAPAIAPAE